MNTIFLSHHLYFDKLDTLTIAIYWNDQMLIIPVENQLTQFCEQC